MRVPVATAMTAIPAAPGQTGNERNSQTEGGGDEKTIPK